MPRFLEHADGLEIRGKSVDEVWHKLLVALRVDSHEVGPRGKMTREITNVRLKIEDARNNILINSVRKVKYDFMIAEWLWIWFGREDVKSIAMYNNRIAEFSDDGERFAGAYGPRVRDRFPRCVQRLTEDSQSRQAVIDIFRFVGDTKDVPCTLTMQFFIRGGKLHTTVNMRSSDVWLGLPYDIFNFTMIGNCMAASLKVPLGSLTMNLGSSHLYEDNWDAAEKIIRHYADLTCGFLRSPLLINTPPQELEYVLETRRMPREFIDWPWIEYARILSRDESTTEQGRPQKRIDILTMIDKTSDMTL